MARVKDEVIDVMERDGVTCAEAMRILEDEGSLNAFLDREQAKEREKYAEVDWREFINVVRGDK